LFSDSFMSSSNVGKETMQKGSTDDDAAIDPEI
jgi:hypothetical protein